MTWIGRNGLALIPLYRPNAHPPTHVEDSGTNAPYGVGDILRRELSDSAITAPWPTLIYLYTKEAQIMSVGVAYPVEIMAYQVSVKRAWAEIDLAGVEGPAQASDDSSGSIKHVGRLRFSDSRHMGDKDFFNRGGSLEMRRPLAMFSGVLELLRNEKPLFLHRDGTLSTSLEFVGEEGDQPALPE